MCFEDTLGKYKRKLEELKKDRKSQIALRGVSTKRYKQSNNALFEIYKLSQNNRYKNIDNLKEKWRRLLTISWKYAKNVIYPKFLVNMNVSVISILLK